MRQVNRFQRFYSIRYVKLNHRNLFHFDQCSAQRNLVKYQQLSLAMSHRQVIEDDNVLNGDSTFRFSVFMCINSLESGLPFGKRSINRPIRRGVGMACGMLVVITNGCIAVRYILQRALGKNNLN